MKGMTAKVLLDGLMVFLFLLLMADRHVGNAVHEWLGLLLGVLAFCHAVWNRRWYGTLFKGRYNPIRGIRLLVNLLLPVAFIGTVASAVPISASVFAFLDFEGALSYRTLHVFCAHWAFLLAAVHFGLYASAVLFVMKRHAVLLHGNARVWTFLGTLFACYGLYALSQRELGAALTMRSSFMFWGEQDSLPRFLLDYGAIFFLFLWTAFLLVRRPGGGAVERMGKRSLPAGGFCAVPPAEGGLSGAWFRLFRRAVSCRFDTGLRQVTAGSHHEILKELGMKKVFFLVAVCVVLGLAAAFAGSGEARGAAEETRVRMVLDGGEAVVVLDDHPASRDFLSLLPLTLTFEDFNHTEKIAYLPRKLDTQSSPDSCDPATGSFTYYAPWGNLAVFYRDFRHSEGLVPLGSVESGMEHLSSRSGDFSVRLERME